MPCSGASERFHQVMHLAIYSHNYRILEEQLDTAVDHEVNIKLSRAGEVMNIHLRVVDFHKLLLGKIIRHQAERRSHCSLSFSV